MLFAMNKLFTLLMLMLLLVLMRLSSTPTPAARRGPAIAPLAADSTGHRPAAYATAAR